MILIVIPILNPDANAPALALLAPILLGWLLGIALAGDLSYDGTAIWLHAASGVSGADDRAGRVMSSLTIFAPLDLAVLLVAFVITGQWSLLPTVVGLTVGLMLAGLGVGCVVGVLWQWPAPPPGANPFTKGNSGGLPALAASGVMTGVTLLIMLPTGGLAVLGLFVPWVQYVTLLVGIGTGFVVLVVGIRRGGELLDRRWPEVLDAVRDA